MIYDIAARESLIAKLQLEQHLLRIQKDEDNKFDTRDRIAKIHNQLGHLNDNGLLVWRHNTIPDRWVDRQYYWCDRVLVLDGRKVIEDTKFSDFDFSEYTPITSAEYKAMLVGPLD